MKKILFAIVIVLTIGLTANAQSKNDAFVADWGSNSRDWTSIDFLLPTGAIGDNSNDFNSPLGSGLLVLTALGAGYAVARKRKR